MNNHTPEPWHWKDGFSDIPSDDREDNGFPKYADCRLVSAGGSDIIPIRVDHRDSIWDISEDEVLPTPEDRARIVACVNAMQGIADPAAFVKAFEAMRESITEYLNWGAMTGSDRYLLEQGFAKALILANTSRPKPTPAPTDGERTSTVTD
jgi:hypothetical protein